MNISTIVWLIGSLGAIITLYLLSTSPIDSRIWKSRRTASELLASLLIVTFPFLFATSYSQPNQLTLALCQLVLLLLCVRIIISRVHPDFLRNSTVFNVAGLALLTLIFTVISLLALLSGTPHYTVLGFVIACFGIVVGSIFLRQVVWTLKHYRLRKIDSTLTIKDLPTVTLGIPARNETHTLLDCLQAAIASDYPKLEIIVLDDCSQDKTSQIIRSFAQDGVRFVQGEVPADTWIGKNQACQTLTEQASGEFILFTSVDTRLSPQSISKLVAYILSHKVDMVSVLPQRDDTFIGSNLFQQLRYFWQIAFPITKRRVPVAGSAWIIRTRTLKHLGSFAAVKHKIIPEGSFARQLFKNDLYRFIISNPELGITNAKKWTSQAESALRILYPTLKRQPIAALTAVLLLTTLLVPFVTSFVHLVTGNFSLLFWLSLANSLLLLFSYALVIIRTNPRMWPLTVLLLPFVLVQEAIFVIVSMLSYEFSEVNWKGRNVCYPVITYKK